MPMNRDIPADDYVTVMVGGQLFGLPIGSVQDVFVVNKVTRVPLASDEVAGVINLRGRIVTMIDLRRRLGMSVDAAPVDIAVGVESGGESYGLVIDAIGEVMRLGADSAEPVPVNLNQRLKSVASRIHRLDDGLLVVLDIDRLLNLKFTELAA